MPLTVEGNHVVVMHLDPFFKRGSDSQFDPSKDSVKLCSCVLLLFVDSSGFVAKCLFLNFKVDSPTVLSWLDPGHDFRCEPMF